MKEISVIYFEWRQPFKSRPLVSGPGSRWLPPATFRIPTHFFPNHNQLQTINNDLSMYMSAYV